MSVLDHTCNTVDLVTATVCPIWLVVHGVFVEDLVDCRASTTVIALLTANDKNNETENALVSRQLITPDS
jgi:hypothetical protein